MLEPLADLERVLHSRRDQLPEGSYSATLLSDHELLQRKIMEEAFELCIELGRSSLDRQRLAQEAADVLFHVLVGLVAANVSLKTVVEVLQERKR